MNEETVLFPLKDSGCKRQTPKLAFFRRTWGSNQSRPASSATRSHSLRSALILKSVAENVIKPAEVNQAESPLNCNVERQRSMEAS